jgi:hypothetical protein
MWVRTVVKNRGWIFSSEKLLTAQPALNINLCHLALRLFENSAVGQQLDPNEKYKSGRSN